VWGVRRSAWEVDSGERRRSCPAPALVPNCPLRPLRLRGLVHARGTTTTETSSLERACMSPAAGCLVLALAFRGVRCCPLRAACCPAIGHAPGTTARAETACRPRNDHEALLQLRPMKSHPSLARLADEHQVGLAALVRLLHAEASEAVAWHVDKWAILPGASALSGLTRQHLALAAKVDQALLDSGIRVEPWGDDWIRLMLPGVPLPLPLRTRPKSVTIAEPLLDEDVLALDPLDPALFGHRLLFWRFDRGRRAMVRWTLARVRSLEFEGGCVAFEEVPLPLAPALTNPVVLQQPVGTANEDDDLDDVVGAWESEQPRSEAEATDADTGEDVGEDDAEPGSGVGS
jgi:hypothetical protein